ncbi:serine/threonine protein kinase CHK1 [Sugiyamaella lignohabitans]|uniref:non-specific serine/threonine protein kinase n=1 Tax=Sugiyamaella lignohabitans TaxID=796027 RepID=A0A167FGX5_9ASCO|nr:serine/threonine protein kinase CHK1 [Sugiyamaella lignohabitans]ANB15285.1 serine/threonine protein kinase CHK1 [Sugiyamaella lignohabitans]
MEYAEGGDLFDKIEPDVGVPEDVAHFYFQQLVNGVGFLHSKGVAHRDIKPENIMLDGNGNLKIGDFGLAGLFRSPDNGTVRKCNTCCGSPPYIAPEVIDGEYDADKVDIWSMGVVLFVLFAGITPWNEPLIDDSDFGEYVRENGRVTKGIWERIPLSPLSLLRGMMKLDAQSRYTIDDIRRHPWYTQPNRFVGKDGSCGDPVGLATELLKNLHIDLDVNNRSENKENVPLSSSRKRKRDEHLTEAVGRRALAFGSQPVDILLANTQAPDIYFSQQQVSALDEEDTRAIYNQIAQDPVQLQFLVKKGVIPLSLSQRATKFNDLLPVSRFTRFYSEMTIETLIPVIVAGLQQLNAKVPEVDAMAASYKNSTPSIPFTAVDRKAMGLGGKIKLESHGQVIDVNFVKYKGDPLEWRYFFKRFIALRPDIVYIQEM